MEQRIKFTHIRPLLIAAILHMVLSCAPGPLQSHPDLATEEMPQTSDARTSNSDWSTVTNIPEGTGVYVSLRADAGELAGELRRATPDSLYLTVSTIQDYYPVEQLYGLRRISIERVELAYRTDNGGRMGAGLGFLAGALVSKIFKEPGSTLSTVLSSGSFGPPAWLVVGPLGFLAGLAVGTVVDANIRTIVYTAP